MAKNTAYLEFLLDWLSPLGRLDSHSMFGGWAIYCEGRVFALVAREALWLKVDDATRGRFEELGLKAFQPFPDKPNSMSYYAPPAEFYEDRDVMLEWGSAAVGVAIRAADKKKKPAKKRAQGLKQ